MVDVSSAHVIERAPQDTQSAQREITNNQSLCSWLLKKMPEDMAKTFTDGQLAAIETALEDGTPGKKAVDVRFSIPLFRRRAFLVFLAGLERRSPERRSQDRGKHALWTFANACAFAFIFLFLIPAFMGMGHIITLYLGYAPYRYFGHWRCLGWREPSLASSWRNERTYRSPEARNSTPKLRTAFCALNVRFGSKADIR